MNILVVHAMIILLTYGQPRGEHVTDHSRVFFVRNFLSFVLFVILIYRYELVNHLTFKYIVIYRMHH